MGDRIELTGSELTSIRKSWIEVQTNNRYHKDEFVSRLYANIFATNPSLKSIFQNDQEITEDSMLLGDLLSYTVMFLHDPEALQEFLSQFYSGHLKFVTNTMTYLETMGTALIQTFKQWLGNGKFNKDMERMWIKVYIYIANAMLSYDTDEDESSEISSTFSKAESDDRHTEEEEVQPLNISSSKPSSMEPEQQIEIPAVGSQVTDRNPKGDESEAFQDKEENPKEKEPEDVSELPEQNFVVNEPNPKNNLLGNEKVHKFQLSSNEKYRGFRRSVSFNTGTEPIAIKIPESESMPKVNLMPKKEEFLPPTSDENLQRDSVFDPRKSKRSVSPPSEEKEDLPERSRYRPRALPSEGSPSPTRSQHKRNSSISCFELESDAQSRKEVLGKRPSSFSEHSKVVWDVSDEEYEEEREKGFGFDPRKSVNKKPSFNFPSSQDSSDRKEVHGHFQEPELTEKNVEDNNNYQRSRAPVFEPISFGLKGLDPIVEADDDDNTSSKYESDGENSEHSCSVSEAKSASETDEVSSGASSLSLHNSDHRSSISSGTEASAFPSPMTGGNKIHDHKAKQPSVTSEISYMRPLSQQIKISDSQSGIHHSRSYASLVSSSTQARQRASLGFMRSSFVLKKEMELQGYNLPENVLTKPPTIPAAESVTSSGSQMSSQSTSSSQASTDSLAYSANDDKCFEMLNAFNSDGMSVSSSFEPKSSDTTKAQANKEKNKSTFSNHDTKKTKRGFSFSSLFSKSKSSSKPKISAPITHMKQPIEVPTSSSAEYKSLKKSSSASTGNLSKARKSCDNASVISRQSKWSLTSGFAFLTKRRSMVSTNRNPIHV